MSQFAGTANEGKPRIQDLDILLGEEWIEHARLALPSRPASIVPVSELNVCEASSRYLQRKYPSGVYSHQALAASHVERRDDLLLATATASGKSAAFHLAAFKVLDLEAKAKTLVAYPLKALALEQEDRWKEAMTLAGLSPAVGRIDGSVPVREREGILDRSSVVLITPDVIHAWLLNNLAKRKVARFVSHLRLFIVDELHTYTGVFGSNAAFLFRRLEHAARSLGGKRVQYLTASATIANPSEHAKNLFGRDFAIIGAEQDGAPRHEVAIHLLKPAAGDDLLANTSALLKNIVAETDLRFICFNDSRRQVETLASILSRQEERPGEPVGNEEGPVPLQDDSYLENADVLPYRSGYEMMDRQEIQRRLERGELRGVVSTSAFELGMDIPNLDIAVLLGVPQSSTSFFQRIGRIGRSKPGHVFVLNSGTPDDNLVFDEPEGVLHRPLVESKLYLDNPFIRYIHTMCLGRPGGEHDAIQSALGRDAPDEFSSSVSWPEGFVEMVNAERAGSVPPVLQGLKSHGGDNPNYAFPLRDVEPSFKIHLREQRNYQELGSISYSQLMREAYPGAVYLHLAKGYRVTRVNTFARTVDVRKEKVYFTKPRRIPTQAYPNFDPGSVYAAYKRGRLHAFECDLQISERVVGFEERRGPNTFTAEYPLSASKTGVYFDRPMFTRHYFTTGVVLSHPSLSTTGLDLDLLASLLLRAFGLHVAFDGNDISGTSDRLRISHPEIERGSPILVVYDQTYGSLRLSSRLLAEGILEATLESAVRLVNYMKRDVALGFDEAKLDIVRNTLQELHDSSTAVAEQVDSTGTSLEIPSGSVQVIALGSYGMATLKDNVEFRVESVFFSPAKNALAYRGRLSVDGQYDTHVNILAIDEVAPIPGVSSMALYNLETGELSPSEEAPDAPASAMNAPLDA